MRKGGANLLTDSSLLKYVDNWWWDLNNQFGRLTTNEWHDICTHNLLVIQLKKKQPYFNIIFLWLIFSKRLSYAKQWEWLLEEPANLFANVC